MVKRNIVFVAFTAIVAFALIITLNSCTLLANLFLPGVKGAGTGMALVRYGNYVYRIGGLDNSGRPLQTCFYASIETDEQGVILPLAWQETASLPEGRSFAAVIAAGGRMYVIGGDNGDGPTSTIYVTQINSDGTLGYGTSHFWESSLNTLPSPRSHMAWALHDGRIFLVGGFGPEGVLDSIIHARIWQTTLWPGTWYESPQHLPKAVYGSGLAVSQNRMFIAGGFDSSNRAVTNLISYDIGTDGLLSNPVAAQMPEPKAFPLCLDNDGQVIIAGGYAAKSIISSSSWTFDGTGFASAGLELKAEGPSSAHAATTLWYVKPNRTLLDLLPIGSKDGMQLPPEAPVVFPGSGMVPKNTTVLVKAAPGTTVRYCTDHTPVMVADPVWNEASPLKITADTMMAFRAFATDGTPGAQVNMDYRVRPASFFVWVSGDFTLKDVGDTTLQNISLTDNMFNPATTGYTGIWGRLVVSSPMAIALTVRDAASPGYEAVYTGRVRFSLFEGDLYTEVVDIEGKAVRNLLPPTATQPILLHLNPGAYYLRLDDVDGLSGRRLGVSFRKR
ncbi:MAG: hypothetical protein N2067_00675 [Spirochaetaceae bacterium]|nr:hypothetical protein [Spirochaetaceae bacterium]